MTMTTSRKIHALAAFLFAFALSVSFATSNQTLLHAADDGKAQPSYAPEYPNDPPIDVVPTEIVGYKLVKTIDFSDPNFKLDGWHGRNDVALSLKPNALVVDMKIKDPYFFTCPFDDLPHGSLLVKLRVRRTNKGDGQIFFATAEHGYTQEHYSPFKLADDDAFHDYIVPVESKGKILRVRFDIGADEGTAEIERIEFYTIETQPLKFGVATLEDGTLNFNLVNSNPAERKIADTSYYGFDVRKVYPTAALEVDERAYVDRYYPQKRPFEEMEIVAKLRATGETTSRRYFAVNESACAPAPEAPTDGEAPTLRCGKLAVRFAPDASGAEIFRDGVRVAVIAPLLCEEGDGADILAPSHDFEKEFAQFQAGEKTAETPKQGRLAPVFRSISDDGREMEFSLCEIALEDARANLDAVSQASTKHDIFAEQEKSDEPAVRAPNPAAAVGFLKFKLDDKTLAYEFDSPRKIHAPVLRVLGTMKQATLPGVEYLEEGEHSSSTADIKTSEYVRYAPSIYWITQPYAAITTDRGSIVLTYDDPKTQPVFAVPDFLDGDATTSRMNVCATAASGKIRVAPPAPLEDAILWATRNFGIPEPPTPPLKGQAQKDVILASLEKSIIATPEGWAHALLSGDPPYSFKPSYGSDFVSTIWEITGELPKTPRLDFGGSHLPNFAAFFVSGQGRRVVERFKEIVQTHASQLRADGSFRYSGKYLWGNQTDYASGNCANHLYELGRVWSFTGNKDAIDTLLKGCDFMNAQLTPRGAQVWELSLHTPDIMASARCCMANVWAYEGTGEQKYLDAARRWAITGLPFVYLWEDPTLMPADPTEKVGEDYHPMMKYATIAVFGATNWAAPNWMGRPVQWCGLDYAHALILLAKHDDTLDWRKIAEGIVASAECQLCVKEDLIGLLPDSVKTDTQERYPYYINSCVVFALRRMLEGEHTNLSVVDLAGKRVAAPFPARVEDGAVKISAPKGLVYQIMIDGEEIRTIESQGEDVLQF